MRIESFGRAAVGALGLLLMIGAAQAQTARWDGWYFGFNAGAHTGSADLSVNRTEAWTPEYRNYLSTTGSPKLDASGFIGGAQLGWNRQSGNLVWGLEADAQSMRFKAHRDTGVIAGPFAGAGHNARFIDSVSGDSLFTFRARAGALNGPLLFYATGGLALAHMKFSRNTGVLNMSNFYRNSESELRLGWTAGAGIEWATRGSWRFKAEYLYVDLGSMDLFTPRVGNPAVFFNNTADISTHVFRIGINRNF